MEGEFYLKFIMIDFTKEKLEEYNIDSELILEYYDNGLEYHNINHIIYMLEKSKTWGILTDELFFAIMFHDIYYYPLGNNNEYISALIFDDFYEGDDETKMEIFNAICSTKNGNPISKLSEDLIKLDLNILNTDNWDELIEYENGIRSEYKEIDDLIYKKGRIYFLNQIKKHKFVNNDHMIDKLINKIKDYE